MVIPLPVPRCRLPRSRHHRRSHRRRTRITLAAALALLAISIATAYGQGAWTPVAPLDGASDISVRSDILMLAPQHIDPTTVDDGWGEGPEARQAGRGTVVLVPDGPGRGSAAGTRRGIRLGIQVVDGRLLRITPPPLRPATRYRLSFDGIRGMDGTVLPPFALQFRTRHDVPSLEHCSIDDVATLRCQDTIRFRFTTDLQAIPVAPSELVSVDDGGTITYDLRGRHLTVMRDGGWPAGGIVGIHLRLSRLTGDSLDDRRYMAHVRGAGRLLVRAVAEDGRPVPDDIASAFESQSTTLVHGQRQVLRSPGRLGDRWRFLRWESSLPSGAHPGASVVVDATDCRQLADTIRWKAVLRRLDSVPVIIRPADGDTVAVFDVSGTLITIVDQARTVWIADTDPSVIVVARPGIDRVFRRWRLPLGGVGDTSPVLMLGNGLFADWSPGDSVAELIPEIVTAPTTGMYRLRAMVHDVDQQPGFAAADGVRFTTADRFAWPNVPERATVCVQAQPCWEIVGWVGTTGPTILDQAVPALCATDWMTDPETIVTFLVRRIAVRVTAELAALASENTDDILWGQRPHDDARVQLEYRRYGMADGGWTPLAGTTCAAGTGLASVGWSVRCGDEVRLRIRDARHRGLRWRGWALVDGFVRPAEAGTDGDETLYTMVVDRQLATDQAKDCRGEPLGMPVIRLRACFLQQFGVAAIAVRLRTADGAERTSATFDEHWLDPLTYSDHVAGEPTGGRQLEYVPGLGTITKVRFTLPIDIRTIDAGGMVATSFGNVNPHDPTQGGLDFTVATARDVRTSFSPANGEAVTTVEFRIADPTTSPRKQALHFGSILLAVETGVRSLRGQPLTAPVSFILKTIELPGYAVQFDRLHLRFDGDNDFIFENDGEIYHAVYGGILGSRQAYRTGEAFQRIPSCAVQQGTVPDECTIDHSDKDPAPDYGMRMLVFEPAWLDGADYAFVNLITYDEDCKDRGDCFVNNVYELLGRVRDRMGSHQGSDDGSLDWERLLPDIIRYGADFIAGLLPVDDQDTFLGEATFVTNRSTYYGTRQGSTEVLPALHVAYQIRKRFYPRAAVLF